MDKSIRKNHALIPKISFRSGYRGKCSISWKFEQLTGVFQRIRRMADAGS